jgi:hypothetical protein
MGQLMYKNKWRLVVGLLFFVGCGEPDPDEPAAGWQQAFAAEEAGWVMSVAGSSASNVYAVGGEPEAGRLWHFDGQAWEEAGLPESTELLNWVHVFDDGTPIVVGNSGVVLRREAGDWVAEQTPTEEDLWGVWGADPSDMWAVGGDGRTEGAAVVLRFEGDQWQEVPVPDLERPNVRAFFKVWGTSSDNVYMVGQRGAVLRFDGDELTEELVGTSVDLISLWGTSADNIVLVGGRSNGVVVHFDGDGWRVGQQAPLSGINGVWMVEPGEAWVGGNRGLLGRLDVDTLDIETDEVDTGRDIHAVFGLSGEHLYAVGGNFFEPQGPYRGVALERGGR